MKLDTLKQEVQKYQYLEDTGIIDVTLASLIANRMKLGDLVWLLIIGAPSGGKSQILRPIALTDDRFMHRVDDLTENTFLSGIRAKDGEQVSLLHRIGLHGIIVISDFTVIMSKSKETRATILSQFRMIYDGEMTKYSGNMSEPIKWQGYMGMIAGSTPSIYGHFEEVSDMGERFIYYRMKEFDRRKATDLALSRTIFGKELDTILAKLYGDYVEEVVKQCDRAEIVIPEEVKQRIIEVAIFAEKVRTNAHKDWRGELIDKIPVSAMPMRTALQLTAIAKGLCAIRLHESGKPTFTDSDLSLLDWCGYSLANEENRAVLKVLASTEFLSSLNTSTIADRIGLDTKITRMILQNLSAVDVLSRSGDGESLEWCFKDMESYEIVRRIEHLEGVERIENRKTSQEDIYEKEAEQQNVFENFGK